MKRIDLHTHAKISKLFAFELRSVHQMIAQARRVGLDGVALVEHFHASNFWEVHEVLGRTFTYAEGVYRTESGFHIVTGAELSLMDNGRAADLVLLGTLDQLRRFNGRLARPATEGYKPALSEAISAARDAGLFVIGAHIFRPGKELAALGRELAALDAIEANGKDFRKDERIYDAARRLGLPVVGGSDAHFWPQIGIKATLLPINEITQGRVTQAIREGLATVESLDYGPVAVQISGAYKRILKARQARPQRVGARERASRRSQQAAAADRIAGLAR
ncbi:MAG TPA: PHP-associated domain-containing protein [bacterium]|nr:PHP-associated domain-containing protein [bacterium]